MSKRPFVKIDNTGNVVDLPLDAASLDGHQMEQTGVESDTTTIPTTAQVKEFVNKNITSEGTTKSAVAYQDNVSANACPYALLNKVGGMSYKSENLLNIPNVAETTTNGITYKAENGAIYVSGTANPGNFGVFINLNVNIPTGTYTFNIPEYSGVLNSGYFEIQIRTASGSVATIDYRYITNSITFTTTEEITSIRLYFNSSLSISNTIITKPMLVSGSTAPTEYQPYFEGIRDSATTSVVSKDSNDNILQTINIPNEIQALEGYGQSNPDDSTEYNYIDFENKAFVRVGYIDNGAWVSSALTTDISQYINDNSIQIEPNGTITFDNQYQQAIPYEYLYDIGIIPIVDEKLTNYLSKAKITLNGTTLTIDLD